MRNGGRRATGRRAPATRLRIESPTASPPEAAAIAAALERFIAETAPPAAAPAAEPSRWQGAALREGVSGGDLPQRWAGLR